MKTELISGVVNEDDKQKIIEHCREKRESLSTYVAKSCLIRAKVMSE